MPKVLLALMLQYGTVSISIPYFHNTVITTNHITDSRFASQYHSQLVVVVALVRSVRPRQPKGESWIPWNYY
jgi:hypothetical protein